MPFSQWRIQDFREWVAGVELRMREETEDRGAVGADGCGVGVSPSPLGLCPSEGHF